MLRALVLLALAAGCGDGPAATVDAAAADQAIADDLAVVPVEDLAAGERAPRDLYTGWWSASPTDATLAAVWGDGAGVVYAVGNGGTILRSGDGGATWAPEASGTALDLEAVWGASATDVWATGILNAILHRDGAGWTVVQGGDGDDLGGVWGTGDRVWAVGDYGTILHRDGANAPFLPQAAPTMHHLNAVWGDGAGALFAVGDAGTILRTVDDGATWLAQASGAADHLHAVWGANAGDVWAAGGTADGVLLRWDGNAWSPVDPGGAFAPPFALTGDGAGGLWSAGVGGELLHRDGGGGWSRVALSADTLDGAWSGGGRVVVVGRAVAGGGIIYGQP